VGRIVYELTHQVEVSIRGPFRRCEISTHILQYTLGKATPLTRTSRPANFRLATSTSVTSKATLPKMATEITPFPLMLMQLESLPV